MPRQPRGITDLEDETLRAIDSITSESPEDLDYGSPDYSTAPFAASATMSTPSTSQHGPTSSKATSSKAIAHKREQSPPEAEKPDLFPICRFIDVTLATHQGVIFNVLNNQAHGTAQYVHAIRTNLKDIRFVPKYIDLHYDTLKAAAVGLVHEHFHQSRINLGAPSVAVTVDDYSMSFTIRGVSEAGEKLLPHGEVEAPLWYCKYPSLLQKVEIGTLPNGEPDETYVVNLRIYQVNFNLRIRSPTEPNQKRIEDVITIPDPGAKRPFNSTAPRLGSTLTPGSIKVPRRREENRPTMQAKIDAQINQGISQGIAEVKKELAREVASMREHYPPAPEPVQKMDSWPPPFNRPRLPDSL